MMAYAAAASLNITVTRRVDAAIKRNRGNKERFRPGGEVLVIT